MTTLTVLRDKVGRSVTDAGWRITAARAIARLWSPVYEHQVYRIYRIDLGEAPPAGVDPRDRFRFRLVESGDEDALDQIRRYAEWMRDDVAEKIAAGSICLVGLDDDKVAGFNLVSFGEVEIPLLRMRRRFPDDAAWSEHIAVFKAYRRRGLAGQLRSRIFEELRRRRVKRLYGGALIWNTGSLGLARHLGFTETVDVHYHRVLGMEFRDYRRVPRRAAD